MPKACSGIATVCEPAASSLIITYVKKQKKKRFFRYALKTFSLECRVQCFNELLPKFRRPTQHDVILNAWKQIIIFHLSRFAFLFCRIFLTSCLAVDPRTAAAQYFFYFGQRSHGGITWGCHGQSAMCSAILYGFGTVVKFKETID